MQVIEIKCKNSWLGDLDSFRTLCFDSKGEIQLMLDELSMLSIGGLSRSGGVRAQGQIGGKE
jgi:hypothetical protein